MLIGIYEREREQWQRTAQLASWQLAAWCSPAPSASKLLGLETELPRDVAALDEEMRQ